MSCKSIRGYFFFVFGAEAVFIAKSASDLVPVSDFVCMSGEVTGLGGGWSSIRLLCFILFRLKYYNEKSENLPL